MNKELDNINLSSEQLDKLREVINIGVGRGANVLNTMLSSHISLQVPFLKLLSHDEFLKIINASWAARLASVNMPFKGAFSGTARLLFPSESALQLVSACTGEKPDESEDMDSIRAGTLSEIGNIVLNSVMGTISNLLRLAFSYSIPVYMEGSVNSLFDLSKLKPGIITLLARTEFIIEKLNIKGNVVIIFELGSFNTFITLLDRL